MLLIGLTGSIATGKSTVSSLLRSPPHNLPIIDADILARQVVEPGTSGYAAIVAHFGPKVGLDEILLPREDEACGGLEQGKSGKGRPLNRAALGRAVFGMEEERVKDRNVLNGIVHPAVRREMWKKVLYCYMTGHWAVILDIPLLFEGPLHQYCGTVLVVGVTDPSIQTARLLARDPHLSASDAANRVASQGDVREKAARALSRGGTRGVVVWNDEGKEELSRKVNEVLDRVRAQTPRWWTGLCLVFPPVGILAGLVVVARNLVAERKWRTEVASKKAKL